MSPLLHSRARAAHVRLNKLKLGSMDRIMLGTSTRGLAKVRGRSLLLPSLASCAASVPPSVTVSLLCKAHAHVCRRARLNAHTPAPQEFGISENNPLVKQLRTGADRRSPANLKQEERLDTAAQADVSSQWATLPTSLNS